MPEMVRTGARAWVAEDQRPLGRSISHVVVTVDEAGNELAREELLDEPSLVMSVVHFVDLDDGRRVTTEALGEMSLTVERGCTLEELREELREFIFEDGMREVDEEPTEPRWEEISAALKECGVVADDAALVALPFVVELDDDIAVELGD
jgi:hypothetical protein